MSLLEIPSTDWPSLRDKFLPNWPVNLVGYSTVDNYIRWIQRQAEIPHLHFYCLDHWDDGTFVVVDRYQLFVYSLGSTNERLTNLLRLLDWSTGFKVSSFLERFRPAVLTIVDELELKLEYDSKTVLYYLPRAEARLLQATPPDNIILKPMETWEDAKVADDVWPNRHQGSLFFLKRLIDWSPNIGAYTKDEGKLVAWCFRLQAGPLGALQVNEKFKRQGLGSLVARKMALILAEMGQDTFALVNVGNVASRNMLEKIGFKGADTCYWLRNIPNVPFEWKD